MDEPQRPAELSEEVWQATAPEVRQFIALLVAKLGALSPDEKAPRQAQDQRGSTRSYRPAA